MPPKQKSSKGTRLRAGPRKTKTIPVPRGVPSQVASHLNQMIDPCNAPLGPSIYSGTPGAVRARFRNAWQPPVNPAISTINAGILLAYHPVLGLFATDTYDTGTSQQFLFRDPNVPGFSVFGDCPARGVGACINVAFNGKELDRRGFINYGIVNGGLIQEFLPVANGGSGSSFTYNGLASKLPGVCRMPNDKCEITWVPTEADAELIQRQPASSTSQGTLANQFARHNFVMIGAQIGTPASQVPEIVFTLTAIVEYTPENPTDGIITDAAHVSPVSTGHTVTDLIRMAQAKDATWYVDFFKKAGNIAGRLGKSYLRNGALGLVSEVAGMVLAPRKNYASGG